MWWEDGSGANPFDAQPVTADQLVDLTQDPRVHLQKRHKSRIVSEAQRGTPETPGNRPREILATIRDL